MLTPKQSEFLNRYVINVGPALDGSLDDLTIGARAEKLSWVVKTIRDGYDMWQKRLKGLKDKDPRDRLVNYGWMDRDAKAYRAMLDEAKVFMTTEDKTACDGNIKRLVQQAEDGRLGLRHDVNLSARNAVENEWPALARSAGSAGSRKELLQIIERIEGQMDAMRLSLELAGETTGIVDTFAPELNRLREIYDAKVPAFDGKVEKVPDVSGDKVIDRTFSDEECLKIYDLCGRNWFELKKQYTTAAFLDRIETKLGARPADGETVMWELWDYRKKTVDTLIEKATKEFGVAGKGKGWVAVGSVNLESDYDLSVMEHGEKGEDWQVVAWFNKEFQKTYKTQPGIMFDTNLYASAPPLKKMSDDPQTKSEKAMAAMARSGQDVGALMKQRRFMSWEEYEDMMNTVLDEMERTGTPPEIVKATRTQFEEADDRYQMAQVRTLSRSEEILKGMIGDLEAEETKASDPQRVAKLKDLKRLQSDQAALKQKADSASGSEQAKLILERAEMLERAEDVMLAVNNAIYVDAVEESRKVEKLAQQAAAEIERLETELQALTDTPKDKQDPVAIQKKQSELEEKQKELDGRAARSKDLFTDAVFFANEAYHSDGPFKHVVQATQAVASDMERKYDKEKGEDGAWKKLDKTAQNDIIGPEMEKRRGALSLHDCLQSFNEQLGDFIKDLHHHANDESEDLPGTGFFRSSKYLDRLIDSVALLEQKAEGGLGVKIPGKLKTPKEYRDALDKGLLALRKGKIRIEKQGASEDERLEQMEAFAIAQIREHFGVSTLHDLGKLFKTFGSQVNAKLRAQVAREMQALDAQAFFKQIPKE